jgi:SRR1
MSSNKARDQPPRPRRKQKPYHTKRRLLVDKDGWTHVVDHPRVQGRGNSEDSTGSPPAQSADMTVDEMSREHQRHCKQWEGSDSYTELKARIAGAMADVQNLSTGSNNKHSRDNDSNSNRVMAITNIVCLGLGSLQSLSSQLRQTSHTQLAALETIRSALGAST